MRKVKLVAILLAVLFICGLGQAPVLASSSSIMSVAPPTQKVGIGDTFTVQVVATPGLPVAGGQFDLAFNPAVLEAVDVQEGAFLAQGGVPVFFNQGVIDNTAGIVDNVFGVIAAKGVGATVAAPFATVTLTALTPGISTITLSHVLLGTIGGVATSLETYDGQVVVYPDWDVNMDNSVDVLDMTLIAQHIHDSGAPHWIRQDVKRDGSIDVLDMIIVGQHWAG